MKKVLAISFLLLISFTFLFAATLPSQNQTPSGGIQTPPQEAIDVCSGKSSGSSCSFVTAQNEQISGNCIELPGGELACVPNSAGVDKMAQNGLAEDTQSITEDTKRETTDNKGFWEKIFDFFFGWIGGGEKENEKEIMPGGDEDEHGCKPSAGYTWCEEKQKCLRVFEEYCADEKYKDYYDSKNESKSEDVTITVTSNAIVDTNQEECFDNENEISCPSLGKSFYGQDGNYIGNKPSYKDNGDGTVTDLNTGLMWIQDAGGKVFYYDARNSISYAGYNDWRIPSIKELYSLMDFSGVDVSATAKSANTPFIDDDVFVFEYGDITSGDRIIDSQWMTSNIYVSKVMNNEECFFGVNFADGRIKCYPTENNGQNNGYFLRYVRGDSYGNNLFVDNNDGTVTDESSGLMWQQSDSGEGLDWENALSYCEDLNLANYTDWRLPNAKELQYIVDYSRSPDTTSSPAIDSIFDSTSFTNLMGEKDWGYYWTGTTHVSQKGGGTAAYISFGRGLGAMNGQIMDVHGAGCQRSDSKVGDKADYPVSQENAPQGDIARVYNYARCVRG